VRADVLEDALLGELDEDGRRDEEVARWEDGGDLHDCLRQALCQEDGGGLYVEGVVHNDELGEVTAYLFQILQLPSSCRLITTHLCILPQGP
jgi:hypothetical protein